MESIPETEGRPAFGSNVLGYDKSRPEYPAWMFDVLLREKKHFTGMPLRWKLAQVTGLQRAN